MPEYETLLLSIDGPVATITLNRPAVLNALNATLFRELDEARTELVADPAVRVLLITGAVVLIGDPKLCGLYADAIGFCGGQARNLTYEAAPAGLFRIGQDVPWAA